MNGLTQDRQVEAGVVSLPRPVEFLRRDEGKDEITLFGVQLPQEADVAGIGEVETVVPNRSEETKRCLTVAASVLSALLKRRVGRRWGE